MKHKNNTMSIICRVLQALEKFDKNAPTTMIKIAENWGQIKPIIEKDDLISDAIRRM